MQPSAKATTPSSVILVHFSACSVCSWGQPTARPRKPSSPTRAHRPTLRCFRGVPRAISASRALLTSGTPSRMTVSRAGREVRADWSAARLTPLHSARSSSLHATYPRGQDCCSLPTVKLVLGSCKRGCSRHGVGVFHCLHYLSVS